MRIVSVDITPKHGNSDLLEQAAILLLEGFRDMSPDYCPDLEAAQKELSQCLEEGRKGADSFC